MQYPEGNGAAAAAPTANGAEQDADRTAGDSLRGETLAAAGAVAAHIRNVTATAKTEAELSVASVASILAAAIVSLLLAVTAWLCLVAAAVWWAVGSGLSVVAALLVAGAIHLAVVLALFLWSKTLLSNIGFSRTRQLVFPESRGSE